MRLPPTLPARFVARPNRFVVLAEVQGTVVRCHCPSPGRLRELLLPGADLRVARVPGPGRRTTHRLLLARHAGVWVGVDTQLASAAFHEALAAGRVAGLRGTVAREVGLPGGRLDFRVGAGKGGAWVEVKAVNLVRDGVALFPDAPSTRAARHADLVARCARRGERAMMAFVVLRPDARRFAVNEAADPAFAAALARARRAGVEVQVRGCAVSASEVRLTGSLPWGP